MVTRIRTAERTADILCCFTADTPELSVTQIANTLDLDMTTVSRILLTLSSRGLVRRDPISRRYVVGFRVVRLAHLVFGHVDLAACALPHMRWLRDQTEETVTLNTVVGFERLCLEQVESRQEVKRTIDLDQLYPLYCGAAGKVLLAFMCDEVRDAYFAQVQLAQLTNATITDPHQLRTILDQIRGQGFAISLGERRPGGAGCATPIRDRHGDVVAAIAITMPAMRYDPREMSRFVEFTQIAAERIMADVGWLTLA